RNRPAGRIGAGSGFDRRRTGGRCHDVFHRHPALLPLNVDCWGSAPAHGTCALRPRTSPGGFMTISLTDSVINPPPAVGCFLRRWLCYTIARVNCLELTSGPDSPGSADSPDSPGSPATDGRRRITDRQLRR